jgi:hypothetical protein
MSLLASLMVLVAADGAAQVAPVSLAEPDPKSMSQKQIREFNATVPRNHPYYIRCVRSDETGSIVKKLYSCRTNLQWALADKTGSQEARDTLEAMTSKFWTTE